MFLSVSYPSMVHLTFIVSSDADMDRLLDQWEKDDDPIPPDELPPGKNFLIFS